MEGVFMALVESLSLDLGTLMPTFTLKDPYGQVYESELLVGQNGLLIAFTCNHCPYAIAVWPRLIRLAEAARDLGVRAVAINPNINPDYPDDSPDKMIGKIKEWGISFPYLVDGQQAVARQFQAQCTPDIYLYNASKALVYHGRIDDNWKEEEKVTKPELKQAIEALAAGSAIDAEQMPSMGCSIKWVA